MSEKRKLLLVFVNEADRAGDTSLYEAIIRRLLAFGIAGATVNAGVMGYGTHQKVHHKRLLGISDDRPMTISAADTDEKLRNALPAIRELAGGECLILLLDAEAIG